MKIIKVSPRGYCKGVIHAINIAKQTAKQYPDQNIYVLGMLVHNQYVMHALEKLNIKAIDDKGKTRLELLDQIHDGVVIFTAHGISEKVIEKARHKGLICIDASCSDVVKTQWNVKEYISKGYEVLYIGKKFHPEAEAVCDISPNVHLIQHKTDIVKMEYNKVYVTNQTTMSIYEIQEIFDEIKRIYPDAIFCEEICNATRIRQEAIAALNGDEVDVLYVVGDKHSNNSNKLASIAKEQGIQSVYLIDDVNGIKDCQIKLDDCIAVTAGASTPTYLTNQVIHYLEHYEKDKIPPIIDIHKVL